jgi:hypothetical protein
VDAGAYDWVAAGVPARHFPDPGSESGCCVPNGGEALDVPIQDTAQGEVLLTQKGNLGYNMIISGECDESPSFCIRKKPRQDPKVGLSGLWLL